MLERHERVEDIRKGLAIYQHYVRPAGKLNLTDTNVHAEAFLAGLLNTVYGWKLISCNQATANYPCIDLIDEDQGLSVQVTSEKGSTKLNDTVECLRTHVLAPKVKQLKVFSLVIKQKEYTVNETCPGIAFDWKKDVLDFDDVIREANALADPEQLRRVHQYIVESIPSAFPAYHAKWPPLYLPVTDPAKAWLAFTSRATTLLGRDAEIARLLEFLNTSAQFSWWMLTGSGGSGKSRLAMELCRHAIAGWHVGFLSRTETFDWARFTPSRKTLIVIDYVASRAAEIGGVVLTLCRAADGFTQPVRVLLVERGKDAWWTTFAREESQSESAEILACQHGESLALSGLSPESIIQLAEQVVRARNGAWNPALAREFLLRLFSYDPRGRPLFAMIVANYLDAAEADTPIPNLLQVVLKREAARRSKLVQDNSNLQRMENLLLLATLVSGLLPKANSFAYLAASDVAGLLPNADLLDQDLYNEMAGTAGASASLGGLQPDILGERFLLDRLSADALIGQNARRLLLAAWAFQPQDLKVVAIRTAADFQEHPGLSKLFDVPLISREMRMIWAEMVAEMIGITRSFEDSFALDQLQKLIAMADGFPDERDLQETTARAEYNMGCNLFFGRIGGAAERFDAVIARATPDSRIGIMAVLNRGCLHVGEADKIQAFTAVIESDVASSESRGCALNNRANVCLDRGEHERAIRDRTEVLALPNTSPDRRFVALFRRSESYVAIKNLQAALDDMFTIMETTDITDDDKASATLMAAIILHQMNQPSEARVLMEAAAGTILRNPETLCGKAEASRRAGNHAEAGDYFADAMCEYDASEDQDIRVLIVGVLLFEDRNDVIQAAKMRERLRDSILQMANRQRVAFLRIE